MSVALPHIWDYEISEDDFIEILEGRKTLGRLDRDWAAVRLIEYAPYGEIIRFIGYPALVAEWSRWRERVRSRTRKRGLDWLVEWLPRARPELLQ